MISIHGFNSDTLHTETLVQNITNAVLQSSGPTCSQHVPHIVCDKEILLCFPKIWKSCGARINL